MYTGIIQARLPVHAVCRRGGICTFSLEFPESLLAGLETGASVAVNGVCFTVTRIQEGLVSFDAVRETLELSNIDSLASGSIVNIERSARQDAEIGGHLLSGHVVGTARVCDIAKEQENCRMTFLGDRAWLKYVFHKGFLAINGASLTVAGIDRPENTFHVNLIPETLKRTNFSCLQVGDEVNIEIDSRTQVIVDTVERIMAEQAETTDGPLTAFQPT